MAGSPWAGSEELWAAMADEALQAGHEVAVSIYGWPKRAAKIGQLQAKGLRVLLRPVHDKTLAKLRRRLSGMIQPFPSVERRLSTFKQVFDFKPDVICINEGGTYECLYLPDLLPSLYRCSIPYVVITHLGDGYTPESRAPARALKFLGRAHRVAFVALHSLRATERQLAAPLVNGTIVRNPVNLSDFTAVAWPESGPIHLASVARLDVHQKAQDVLLETLSSLEWLRRDWRLTFFGDGPDRAYLQRLAAYYGLSLFVDFRGHVSDVRTIWAEHHLLVLPSRLEGAPLALVEAMLCGRPAVVTDVGGNTEWLEDGETGFVAAAPTAKPFGAALERAWRHQASWRDMGLRAHERAMLKVDLSAGKTLLKILSEAAGQAQEGTPDAVRNAHPNSRLGTARSPEDLGQEIDHE